MKTIMVCIKHRYTDKPSCGGRGSDALACALEHLIADRQAPVKVHRFPCLGLCELGPNMKVVAGEMYHHVSEAMLPDILQSALDEPEA